MASYFNGISFWQLSWQKHTTTHLMLANMRLSKDKVDSMWTSLESVSDSFCDGDKPPSAPWTGFSSNAEDFKDQGGSCMVSYFERTSIWQPSWQKLTAFWSTNRILIQCWRPGGFQRTMRTSLEPLSNSLPHSNIPLSALQTRFAANVERKKN